MSSIRQNHALDYYYHVRQASLLMAEATALSDGAIVSQIMRWKQSHLTDMAQVHAVLAQASATMFSRCDS